jgi:hypothetical protein
MSIRLQNESDLRRPDQQLPESGHIMFSTLLILSLAGVIAVVAVARVARSVPDRNEDMVLSLQP